MSLGYCTIWLIVSLPWVLSLLWRSDFSYCTIPCTLSCSLNLDSCTNPTSLVALTVFLFSLAKICYLPNCMSFLPNSSMSIVSGMLSKRYFSALSTATLFFCSLILSLIIFFNQHWQNFYLILGLMPVWFHMTEQGFNFFNWCLCSNNTRWLNLLIYLFSISFLYLLDLS